MARYSKEDILKMVEENGVDFIRLQFTDVQGKLKNVAVTYSQLEKILNNQCSAARQGKIPYYNPSISKLRLI